MNVQQALSRTRTFDTLAKAHGFANVSTIGQRIVSNGAGYIVCTHAVAAVLMGNGYYAIY